MSQTRTPNSTGFSTPYRFNAKELDSESGLFYYRARYYHPVVSKWLSVDPLAHKLPSWSPYAGMKNNPIYFVDPDGQFPWPYIDAIVDIGFALYDIGEMTYDYITKGKVDPISVAALTADVGSIFIPMSTGAGLAVRAGAATSKVARTTKIVKRTAEEVNELAIKSMRAKGIANPKAPYKAGTKVAEGVLSEQKKLVRVSGPKNVDGDWFVDPKEIKGLTPKEIKDKLSLKYEPTNITEVTLDAGTKVREGIAAPIKEFGTGGGGRQIEFL
ncbi:RHS repeat domain-containing protein [Schleiferia thermophila]|uniref:RHS repeat domain-containing protein n=1 Tax=Schleiferia thermophila TaxID=884107 RepID=UPI001F3BD70E|nr:RHS repeat-associated core domain-containing protein [Schleiferia thermophila]